MRPVVPITAARRSNRPPRAGLAALLLVLSLAVLAGFAALAIDLGLVKYVHQQLRTACEAAALAGAAELMDRNVLFPNRSRGRVCTGIDELDADRDNSPALAAISAAVCDDGVQAQVERAGQIARRFAALNYVNGQPLLLDPDQPDDRAGNVVAGWVEDPSDCKAAFTPWHQDGAVNSLLVRAQLAARRGNAVGLWLAKLLGMPTADVGASARASVDQRVYGVRPAGSSLAPLVPLAVNYDRGRHSWLAQAFAAAKVNRNDCYSVDCQSRYVSCGGDGIPEVRLEIELTPRTHGDRDNCANAALVCWHEAGTQPVAYRPHAVSRWIECGVAHDDLAALGGALLVGQTLDTRCPANSSELRELCEALLAARGQSRIWPLTESHSDGGARVVSLAAGVVVDAWIDQSSGRCVVLVQPTVLATNLALASRQCPHNPWIGKLQLTQ